MDFIKMIRDFDFANRPLILNLTADKNDREALSKAALTHYNSNSKSLPAIMIYFSQPCENYNSHTLNLLDVQKSILKRIQQLAESFVNGHEHATKNNLAVTKIESLVPQNITSVFDVQINLKPNFTGKSHQNHRKHTPLEFKNSSDQVSCVDLNIPHAFVTQLQVFILNDSFLL